MANVRRLVEYHDTSGMSLSERARQQDIDRAITEDAKFLEDKKMAYVKRENELTNEFFFECIDCDINKMSKALVDSIDSNSIESIVDIILNES